jgi:hypothetical protein
MVNLSSTTYKLRAGEQKMEGEEEKKKGNQGGQNFGEEEKGSDREGSKTEQSEGTEKLKPKEKNRGGKLSKKREEQRLGGSLHRGEEGPFLTTWAPPLCFLSSATTSPSSPSLKQPCTVRNRRRNTEKNRNRGRRSSDNRTTIPPPSITAVPATTGLSSISSTAVNRSATRSCRCPLSFSPADFLLRLSSCLSHRLPPPLAPHCPSRRPDHRHRRSAFRPSSFFFFFFFFVAAPSPLFCVNSGE